MTAQPRTTEADGRSGMEQMAETVKRHHEVPMTGAADPLPNPFPATLMRGFWLSVIFGGLLGTGFGALLYTNTIVVDGWEQIFSIGGFSFHIFWIAIGVALGILVGGIGTIIFTSTDAPVAQPRAAQRESEQGSPQKDSAR